MVNASMAPLNESPLLKNIRSYNPQNFQSSNHSVWHKVPVARRSAVFILLFLGKFGELRVVLTKRSSKLRNFPGHISFPGGKADSGLESEWEVARREMCEEIGLDSDNDVLKKQYNFTIDHVNVLPCYLSRTFSAVRPCVGFMKMSGEMSESELLKNLNLSLNPGESSSIFSCPLKDFLYPTKKLEPIESQDRTYYPISWGGIPWNLRSYTFKQRNPNEADWLSSIKDLSDDSELELDDEVEDQTEQTSTLNGNRSGLANSSKRNKKDLSSWGNLGSRRDSSTNEKIYDVWGLTANILHDLSEIIYAEDAKKNVGEEELIYSIWFYGNQMKSKERSQAERKLISSNSEEAFGFNDILPRTEFNRLKKLYKL